MKKIIICFSLILSIIFQMTPGYAAQRKLVLDVVALNWMGAEQKSTDSFTVAKVIENEVNESWKRFTRIDGNKHNLSYEISLGQVVNEEYFLSKPLNCEDRFLESFFMELRDWANAKLKIEDVRNRVIVVLTPPADCIWVGKASLGNNQRFGSGILLQDTSSAFVINHELGHILGLGHSNLLRCSNGK